MYVPKNLCIRDNGMTGIFKEGSSEKEPVILEGEVKASLEVLGTKNSPEIPTELLPACYFK